MANNLRMRMMTLGGVIALTMGSGAIVLAGGCPQDINGDSADDSADLGIFLGSFGSTDANSDFNQDGIVDQRDWGIFVPYFFQTNPPCLNSSNPGQIQHSSRRLDNSDVRLLDDSFEPTFDGGVTHFSFDIDVMNIGGNNWTSSSLETVIEAGSPYKIFQTSVFEFSDSINSNENFASLLGIPSLFYDTAVTTPGGFSASFAVPMSSLPKSYGGGVWFWSGISGVTTNGVVTRLTIIRPNNSAPDPVIVPFGACQGAMRIGTVNLTYTTGFTEGELLHADFEIIEGQFFGDVNGDLVVDTADMGILIGNFGSDHPYSDANNDGVVDTADLGLLLGEFGFSCK